jgi:hypothetical protein
VRVLAVDHRRELLALVRVHRVPHLRSATPKDIPRVSIHEKIPGDS